MLGIGGIEMIVILVIALLVFGPKKLPQLARTMGKGLAEFRRASNDLRRSFDMEVDPHKIDPPPGPAQASSPHIPDIPPMQVPARDAEALQAEPQPAADDPEEPVVDSDDESHQDMSDEDGPEGAVSVAAAKPRPPITESSGD
jgi:sec-independent protein translocase protein TatB